MSHIQVSIKPQYVEQVKVLLQDNKFAKMEGIYLQVDPSRYGRIRKLLKPVVEIPVINFFKK